MNFCSIQNRDSRIHINSVHRSALPASRMHNFFVILIKRFVLFSCHNFPRVFLFSKIEEKTKLHWFSKWSIVFCVLSLIVYIFFSSSSSIFVVISIELLSFFFYLFSIHTSFWSNSFLLFLHVVVCLSVKKIVISRIKSLQPYRYARTHFEVHTNSYRQFAISKS